MGARGEETGGSRFARVRLVVVAVAYVGLAVFLLVDLMQPMKSGLQVAPFSAHRVADVAAGIGRARGVNAVIAVAAGEAAGDEVVLELPAGYRELLNRTPDSFTGRITATLDVGLLGPFIGGRVREADYDPILSSEAAKSIEASASVIRLPMDVWALPAVAGVGTARFYTDAAKIRIYVVPLGTFDGKSQ